MLLLFAFFHRTDICIYGAKTVVGKTAGASAQVKAMAVVVIALVVVIIAFCILTWNRKKLLMFY